MQMAAIRKGTVDDFVVSPQIDARVLPFHYSKKQTTKKRDEEIHKGDKRYVAEKSKKNYYHGEEESHNIIAY